MVFKLELSTYDNYVYNLNDINAQCIQPPACPTMDVSELVKIDSLCTTFD